MAAYEGDCNLQNVVKYLDKIRFPSDKAEDLGYALKTVPHNRIENAVAYRSCHESFVLALLDIIQYWLNNDPEAHWEKLVRALDGEYSEVACGVNKCRNQPLTEGTIVNALIANKFVAEDGPSLAVKLGVPPGLVQSMVASRGIPENTDMLFADIIEAWFNNEPNPSWEKLGQAIDEVNQKKLD